ncbi:hypothetical protein [Humibacter sp. RRB41]|uniref:hypothetical protein n=1 Tax=Humibacter sp. RRB41 TaxID=2919946 RepID=UPI001FAA676D|nr:hypothetical protein [Humibacter sp. RRB41]
MTNVEKHPDAENIPDGSRSETDHEDTASGGVSPDGNVGTDDRVVDPDEVDREHDTDASGTPIDNPSG